MQNGRISKIASNIRASAYPNTQVIDAAGLHLLPGMIDDQVHFHEPRLTQKGDIGTESAAAVAGGINSFMEMLNVKPVTTNVDALEPDPSLHKTVKFLQHGHCIIEMLCVIERFKSTAWSSKNE